MNEKNHSEIGKALNHVLRPMLAAFVQKNLAQHFGANNWWQRGVLDVLYPEQKRFLPAAILSIIFSSSSLAIVAL